MNFDPFGDSGGRWSGGHADFSRPNPTPKADVIITARTNRTRQIKRYDILIKDAKIAIAVAACLAIITIVIFV